MLYSAQRNSITEEKNRHYLGYHLTYKAAVEEAKKIYPTSDSCFIVWRSVISLKITVPGPTTIQNSVGTWYY